MKAVVSRWMVIGISSYLWIIGACSPAYADGLTHQSSLDEMPALVEWYHPDWKSPAVWLWIAFLLVGFVLIVRLLLKRVDGNTVDKSAETPSTQSPKT